MTLPYDMGNAGDLLKHGLLAEYARWWCEVTPPPARLRFFDPFGGRPWEPIHKEVRRRVIDLQGTSLGDLQAASAGRYMGSGHVVLSAAGGRADVLVGDRDAGARALLVASGLGLLNGPGFAFEDAYSALGLASMADLIHIDPFADFIPQEAARQMPRVAEASRHASILLFVLDGDAASVESQAYRRLRDALLTGSFVAQCPKLERTGVRGEGKYRAEVVLVPGPSLRARFAEQLVPRLRTFCDRLSLVLSTTIEASIAGA